ncbi:MAG: hypothetical protein V3T86_15465 [Planctomycetota bacterium]
MTEKDHDATESFLSENPELARRLRSLREEAREPVLDVPAAVDRVILSRAALQLAQGRSRHWLRGYAAAAAVLLCAGLAIWFGDSGPRDPMDIDGDGQVDMVDAYRLALQGGDDAEVERIARRSVALGGAR